MQLCCKTKHKYLIIIKMKCAVLHEVVYQSIHLFNSILSFDHFKLYHSFAAQLLLLIFWSVLHLILLISFFVNLQKPPFWKPWVKVMQKHMLPWLIDYIIFNIEWSALLVFMNRDMERVFYWWNVILKPRKVITWIWRELMAERWRTQEGRRDKKQMHCGS